MSQERLKLAIGRLEHALSHAERNRDAVFQILSSQPREVIMDRNEDYQILEKKHELLKKQATDALVAIENLIPSKGQD